MHGNRIVISVFKLCFLWRIPIVVLFGLSAPLLPTTLAGEEASSLFVEKIRPLLEKHCLTCHNAELKQGGLDLSRREALLHGGESGPAIVPGNAKASLLYKVITHQQQPTMPFKADKLPEEVIAQIANWINAGAPYVEALKVGAAASTPPNVAQAPSAAAQLSKDGSMELFVQHIRPVLETQCLRCHGGGQVKRSGFDLSSREGLLQGGDNGPAVVAGDAQASLLYKRVRHEVQPGMPFQGDKLPEEVIAHIADWINAGAPYDQPLKLSGASLPAVAHPASTHWAFKPPKRPSIPAVKNRAWRRNPIDAFVTAEQEKRGLEPLPPADKRVLLRRVYLDLIGLPPTPEEMRAFLQDRSKWAYEKVVDRLLDSPRYGERWGRHWMDIWRYSDWYGRRESDDHRNSQRHIWHWRDWIIESLNQDKGYDRMIVEMLAADEIAPTDSQTLRATGYLARSFYRYNRNVWLQDVVEHTAAGFLGITLKCARCHDHKYDPIAQEEYYRFRAFFEPYDVRTDRLLGQPDLDKDGVPRVFDAEPRAGMAEAPFLPAIFKETFRFIRGDEKNPDTSKPLLPGVPEALGNQEINIQPVALPLEAYNPDIRSFVQQDLIAQATAEIGKAEAALAKANKEAAQSKQRVAELSTREKETVLTTSTNQAPAETGSASGLQTPSPSGGGNTKGNSLPPSGGEVGPRPEETVSFEKEIQTLLDKQCTSCHNSLNAKSGLALDSLQAILEGGTLNGPAVIARKSQESPLILYLRGEKKPRMPLGGTVPEEQIARIAKWIDQIPEEDPQVSLKKAEAGAALAEKRLAAARANLPALEARIAADKAKYAHPPDPKAESLAQAAQKAERQANLLRAEEDLLGAQQQLAEAKTTLASKPEDEKAKEANVEAARKQLEAALAALKQSAENYTPIAKPYPDMSTGRRSALAYWIASKQNPLTARVAVNHMWLRHFGKPLVPTVVNFGQRGKPPTHPELLDWLATEFMEGNWRMKAMHRLMVTSNTYRMQSSASDPKHPNLSIDPENRTLWRMNPRRMEAEVVRDSVLYLAGQLDTTMGGPDLEERLGEESHRRSLYFRHAPESQMLFLRLFDEAEPTECYVRSESIVPQQALAMANSRLSFAQARLLARHISQQIGAKAGEAEFVAAAFETVLGQPPSAQEQAASEKFLHQQAELFHDPKKLTAFRAGSVAEIPPATQPQLRAREDLVHVLLNHNEFVTIR